MDANEPLYMPCRNGTFILPDSIFRALEALTNGFVYLRMGYASAMAWILFVVILVLTLILLRTSDRWTYYAG